jgi:hypothetical protein
MQVLLSCEVSEGLQVREATVKVLAEDGVAEYLPVVRSALRQEGKRHYLPVQLVKIDEDRGAALVGLPVEADSGARRIWVKLDSLKQAEGALT